MRSNIRQRRAKTREGGGFWLSFSDMMSVLVLVFIFVIFSMMLSLAQTEEQYNIAKARMEASELALSEKETLLIAQEAQLKTLTDELNGKTLLLTQQQEELKEQEALIAAQREEIDERVIILDLEKAQLEEMILDYDSRVSQLSEAEEELNSSRATILGLETALKESQSAVTLLRGDIESQKNQIVLLGGENAALQAALSDADEEKQRINRELSMLKSNLEASQADINALKRQISEKKSELDALKIDYQNLSAKQLSAESVMSTQSEQLSQYEAELSKYKAELSKKQGELERMVGVKAQIIEALSSALSRNRIAVTVDAQTGAITLPSEMLFDTGDDALTQRGMAYLDTFLPVYMSVLLSGEFQPHVAEIIIEGHTDSSGKAGVDPYLFNLQLSQARALSVSNYVLREAYMSETLGLGAAKMKSLRELITASGRSYSALIRNSDGSENMAASRRVEIKFRLKDDETIAATEALLRLMGDNE